MLAGADTLPEAVAPTWFDFGSVTVIMAVKVPFAVDPGAN
jgi:hypothetical protein